MNGRTRQASWDALRVFVAVHRLGSFSAAAHELGLAQSSVSEQMARLERSLGCSLLDRHPGGVLATQRGVELAARISGPVDALAEATAVGGGAARAPVTVFLGGPAEFLSEILLPDLAARLPAEVRIAVRFGLAGELLEDLRAGAIDLLVSTLPVRGPDVAARPLCDEEFVLVASPECQETAKSGLESVPLLAYGPELPLVRRYWRSVMGHRPEGLDIRVTAPDLRTLLRLALSGAGMTVVPDYLAREHLHAGALVELEVPEVPPLNTIFLATRRAAGPTEPAVAAVRDAVLDAVARTG